jgi:hypothetical protein
MEAIYIHRGKVLDDGKLLFDNIEMWRRERLLLVDKRFELRLKEEENKKSEEQLGFLFKGIIRGECLHSEIFAGWTEKEILAHFENELSVYLKAIKNLDGTEIKKEYILTVKSMGKRQCARFIERVIIYCAQLGIVIKDNKCYG